MTIRERKARQRKAVDKWQKNNREKFLLSQFKRRLKMLYGLSLYDYEAALRKQRGVCAICRKKCSTGRRLAVDHNHTTNRFRGLLCVHCNLGIGSFKDSPKLLRRAIAYLSQTK